MVCGAICTCFKSSGVGKPSVNVCVCGVLCTCFKSSGVGKPSVVGVKSCCETSQSFSCVCGCICFESSGVGKPSVMGVMVAVSRRREVHISLAAHTFAALHVKRVTIRDANLLSRSDPSRCSYPCCWGGDITIVDDYSINTERAASVVGKRCGRRRI